jgi:subfamily B ATP-binding cassette protein MsbA
MGHLIRYFVKIRCFIGRKVYYLLAMMLAVGLMEGIGISLFLPILQNGFGEDGLSRAMKNAFDHLNLEYSFGYLLIIITAFFLAKAVILIGYSRYFGRISTSLIFVLRRRLLEKALEADYLYLLKREAGYISNVMVREVERVVDALQKFSFVLNYAIYGLVYVALAFLVNAKVALTVTALGPLFALIMRRINTAINRASHDMSGSHGRYLSLLTQALGKIKYLKATLSGGPIRRIINGENRTLADLRFTLYFMQALSKNILEPLVIIGIVGLIFYHVVLMKEPMAEIIFLVFLLLQVARQFMNVQTSYRKFLSSMGSIETFNGFLKELEENKEDLNEGGISPEFEDNISLKDVSLRFPNGKIALEDINITIKPRSVVALVGHSGSGKSSIANMVAAILSPTSGRILMGGADYGRIDKKVLRRGLGYITQEDVIFNASVRENITLWDEHIDKDRLKKVVRTAHIADFIEGLSKKEDELLGDNGLDISGGQRQRVTVARELYKDSKLLILDEATSSLDSKSEKTIYENLKELRGKKTMIVIAHRLSTIKNADYIYVMDSGRVVEEGTYDQLHKNNGEFNSMVREQALT